MPSNQPHIAQTLPNQIVLASGNQKKLKELTEILGQFEVTLVPQSEYQVSDAIEDGLTFIENAIIKARHACQATGKPAIADDSGIEVDYLNGAPGIYSARYSGLNASDEENLDKLLNELKDVESSQRTARYQCVIAYMRHAEDPTPIICQASWEGILLDKKIGDGGFGYDPIFYCPVQDKTAAQMTPAEKSAISHRGKALSAFQTILKQRYA
ncbi:RdgB/HAM1 family non-canonical purine NTP pyrophosphatase [Aliikangiella coralliicola]|uniref:dITP/XTP pyrophosphatase n=1 Tax=Aliikangiella coralliicola TaxID=2592383 RepID=A0A545U7B8_9GAMM|nr:RdgB/HAM1 family non-canonical purine NTP pyrophosphatase [Aliikangiella coralliicola]TQV85360.1 RdgB/HAM1 family non-canonical purine NTP pyrophosphatase [Aliikangiella coralliicola]